MNKQYHCLRIGLKRKRKDAVGVQGQWSQDSEDKRIREFNINKILNTE